MNAYAHHTDEQLLSLLCQGDETAFAAIYHRYAQSLFRYTKARVQQADDAEEIIQELFLYLWEKRAALSHVELLRAYLYTAVRYKIGDLIARMANRQKYEQHYLLFEARPDNTTEEATNVSDFYETLTQSIAGLPHNCQQAFKLSRIEHLTIPEIATRMQLTTRTVENYITQALKHLRGVWGVK